MNYSESQLNSMNKTTLVGLALDLALQLSVFQSGPLKGSDVEKKLLDLSRQAANIKTNDTAREQAHKEALAKINADKELAIKKLDLEYADTRGLDAEALVKAYAEIEERVKKAKEDLTYGLKEAEIASQKELDVLAEKVEKAKADAEAATKKLAEDLAAAKKKNDEELDALKVAHERKLEQTKYENGIALRDENLAAAEKIAAEYTSVVIDKDQLKELEEFKQADETTILSRIEAAVKSAQSDIYASERAKYNQLKSDSENKISLLEKDKEYLTAQIDVLNTRLAEANEQIKAFPGQLKEAVEAAKSDVTVNQDNKK